MAEPLALLATVPVTVFLLDNGEPFVYAALVNVALIAGALWLLFDGQAGSLTGKR
jgi:hypothetical protein